MADFNALKKEYQALTEQLTNPELISQWEKFQEISKRRAFLEKVIRKIEELETTQRKIEENNQIISSQEEEELAHLAQAELKELKTQEEKLHGEIEALLKGGEETESAVIIEIRAGTGGQEAALFARNLFDMYAKFASQKGFKQTLLDINETDLQGIKTVVFLLEGEGVFQKLQYEGGVHRVQRIPLTEKSGRVHTSTASVAVLAKPQKAQITINPSDLEVETYNSSGPGGQNVNKRQTAVRILHKPSGIVVTSQTSRSQQQNRELAIAQLEARLLQFRQEAQQEKLAGTRKTQIGTSERAEKIRTYNFPQDRVTDHRISRSWHNINAIFEGNLDEIAEALASTNL